jgi:hypothetical protein
MFLTRMFGKNKSEPARPVGRTAPISDLGQWAERRVRRMSGIFAAQGYTGARVDPLIRGARHVVVPVRPSQHDIAKHSNLHQRWLTLADNVGKAAGVKSYAEWDPAGQIFYFLQLPESHWRSYGLDDLDTADAIGLTEYRRAIHYEFDEAYPHALVAGATGSGKSVAIETIIFALVRAYTPAQLGLIIIDPHNSFGSRQNEQVGTFDNLAHLVMPLAKTPEQIEAAWRWAYAEMARRLTLMQAQGHIGDARRIVIVADELAATSVLGRKGQNHEANLLAAKTLGAEARKLRMNLVLGTQKPEEVDRDLFDHLTYRFGGRVTNNALGTRILGRPGFKLAELSGNGDFFVSAREVRRFQFALPDRADFETLPRAQIGLAPVHDSPATLGRIPLVTAAPELDWLIDGDNEENRGGAPVKAPEPGKLAYYLNYGPGNISIADARQIVALQLSRAMHERHREAAQEILDTLRQLRAAGMSLAGLEKVNRLPTESR